MDQGRYAAPGMGRRNFLGTALAAGTGFWLPLAGRAQGVDSIHELRGEHGVVLCLLHIGADGGVTDVEILESCGYGRLDRSALEALKRWRFRPALEHGKAVASTLRHQVTFVFE